MAGIILPNRFAQQPQYSARFDAGRQRGAVFLGSVPVDLVGGLPRSVSVLVDDARPAGKVRRAIVRDDSDTYPVSVPLTNDFTIYLYAYYADAFDAFQYLLGFPSSGNSANIGVSCAHSSIGGNWGLLIGGALVDSSEALPRNQLSKIVVKRSGTSVKMFRDGALKATVTNSATVSSITAIVLNSYISSGSFGGGPGTYYALAGIDAAAWSDAEVSRFSANPWSLFKAPQAIVLGVPAPAGSVALTGQSLTSAQGTLTPGTAKALTGQSLTSSQGTLTPGTAKALAGQSLTSAQGALVPSTSVALTGQALTSGQGTLSVAGSSDVTVALSGQALTASQGSLGFTKSGSLPLTGQAATTAQGTLSPATAVALSGQAATLARGTLAPATSVPLSGQALTSSQGTLAPSATGQSITIQLTGISLTSYQGSLSLDQYIWDTTKGRAQPGRGTFRPLKPHEMSEPEIVVVDIPEEESTCEYVPAPLTKPTKTGPRAGISGIKLPPRRLQITTPVPAQNRDYKSLMARAGKPQKTMKLSDFPITKNKKYLTKTRGPATLKGN